jgi:hypothetical protein
MYIFLQLTSTTPSISPTFHTEASHSVFPHCHTPTTTLGPSFLVQFSISALSTLFSPPSLETVVSAALCRHPREHHPHPHVPSSTTCQQ